MYLPNSLHLLVLVFTTCSADRGNVLGFAPDGEFKYMLSRRENDIHDAKFQLVDVWIKKGGKDFIKLFCNTFEINSNSEYVIKEYRVTLLTTEKIELESFNVNKCDQATLLNSIEVSQSRDETLKKEFQITFKDINDRCLRRTYKVEITPNDDNPSIAVTRSTPESVGGNCPLKKGKPFAIGWYDDGTTHDYTMDFVHKTVYRFDCEKCWVECGKVGNEKFYAQIIAGDAPVDRVKVSSCTKISLQISINLNGFLQSDTRFRIIYMNYLTPDGTCYTRRYEYDVLAHEDRMFLRAIVKREEIITNPNCKTMKVKGLGRCIAKMAHRQIRRIVDRPVTADSCDE